MSLRTPLSRVLGSGSAREGTDHWWNQRVTAVALLLLGLSFIVSLAAVEDFSEPGMRAWAGAPTNAIILILLCISGAWHSLLGVQVVIEDYIHGAAMKVALLLANKFVHILFAVAGILAVLSIVLGGS